MLDIFQKPLIKQSESIAKFHSLLYESAVNKIHMCNQLSTGAYGGRYSLPLPLNNQHLQEELKLKTQLWFPPCWQLLLYLLEPP